MNLETNKSTVIAFYDLMFNKCQPAEAIRRYVGATYSQHNPMGRRRQGRVHCVLRTDGARVPGEARRLSAGAGRSSIRRPALSSAVAHRGRDLHGSSQRDFDGES
jgi:hypothetical protein